MQITEYSGKVIISPDGIMIDNSISEGDFISTWTKVKIFNKAAKVMDKQCREFSINQYGEEITYITEAKIILSITELGFLVETTEEKKKDIVDPKKIFKAWKQIDSDLWKRCKDKFCRIELIESYAASIQPIAERYYDCKNLIEKRKSSE